MNAEERRSNVLKAISAAQGPISAAKLAVKFGVSRQIIVGDVALLRAAGEDITATPRGYIYEVSHPGLTYTIACRHGMPQMEEELNICVDNGCLVENVIVEHPIYGQLEGQLSISNRHDVQEFMAKVKTSKAAPLSTLTDGVHLHTLRCPDEASFKRVTESLREAGILFWR
jgi:transcriptional regulator of NAD metabolism